MKSTQTAGRKPASLGIGLLVAAILLCTGALNDLKAQTTKKAVAIPEDINKLLTKNTCLACHRADTKLVGPAYLDVAKKKYTNQQIVDLIYKPKPSNWPGYPPMAPMTQVPKEEALKIATWINSLAKK